jgi:hypothetical protein
MGIYLSYILYGDFSHTFCMGISLIHFVWDSTFFLLKSGPSSGTGKAPIAEGRALLEVEVLQYPVPSERKILSSRECPVQYPVATIGVKWEKTTVLLCDYSVPLSTQYEF